MVKNLKETLTIATFAIFTNSYSYFLKRTASSNSLNQERSVTPIQRSPFDLFGVAPSEADNIKQVNTSQLLGAF